jgi:peptidoglycan/LPS O-acetylase OafA/YrhL
MQNEFRPLGRVEFADGLRGLASLAVLAAHYVLVFDYIKGQYDGLPALPTNPYPHEFVKFVAISPYLNLGALGVALFFIISGLVVPQAIASLPNNVAGASAFAVGRIFRIWPTYIAGFFVTMLALYCGASYGSHHLTYEWDAIWWHVSLFRDWTAYPSIDGIVWTLEVETKFYLFALVFWGALHRGRIYPLFIIAAAAFAASKFRPEYPSGWAPPSNIIWSFRYLLYMCVGVAFNFHYRNLLTTARLWKVVCALMTVFLWCSYRGDHTYDVPVAYVAGLVIFTAMYVAMPGWRGGPVVQFFARISYPMYVCHAAMGYVIIRILIDLGIPALHALAAATAFTILVSWTLHVAYEKPLHAAGRWSSKWIARCGITTPPPSKPGALNPPA